MRFAVISDIHGNCTALEAVLADIAHLEIDTILNLGDHLSGPLEAGRTADLLMRHDFFSIRGNHDRWLLETPFEAMGLSDAAAYPQLTEDHKQWLRALPATRVFQDEVFLCHGTPFDDAAYWLEQVSDKGIVCSASLREIEEQAKGVDYPLILCGHTHIPRVVRLGDGRLVVNPGSVGCPGYEHDVPVFHHMQAGTPDACYAVIEKREAGFQVSHRHVPYDHMKMSKMAEKAGRPEWARALATGWL